MVALFLWMLSNVMPADLQQQAGPRPLLSFGASVGTGFFISEDGDIITAKHVVAGCKLVRVAGDGFEGQTAKVVALDPDDDLALLHVNDRPKTILQIGDGRWGSSAKTIEAVARKQDFGRGTLLGYPGTSVILVTRNVEMPPKAETPDGKHFYRVVDGWIESGDSGGPVLYLNGQVAGVLIEFDGRQWTGKAADGAREGKGGLFVPGPIVSQFLQAQKLEVANSPASDGESSQEAVVHIFCFTGLPNL